MSFSDTFALGDKTLQELERGFIKNVPKPSNDFVTPPPSKRRAIATRETNNMNNNNSASEVNLYRNDFDEIIEESPTDKTSLTNKSIKERLRKSSRSSARKHELNRSKSEPITPKPKQQQKMSGITRLNDLDAMFDSPMELSAQVESAKATSSRGKVVFNESIDKYFQDSFGGFTQMNGLNKQNDRPVVANNAAINTESMSQFFQSQFSLEAANGHINVSHLEAMLKTQRQNADITSEDLFRDVNDANVAISQISFQETDNIAVDADVEMAAAITVPTTQDMSRIHWDESEFFDDLNINSIDSKPADEKIARNIEMNVNENIVLDGSIRENLNASIAMFIETEVENCNINVSAILNDVPQSQAPMRLPSQYAELSHPAIGRNTPIQSTRSTPKQRPIEQKEVDIRDMQSLLDWGFTRIILEEYKKKGIFKMFDWQAECLNNTAIRNESRNLVYSAPTSAGKTFVSEILMIRNVLQQQRKALVILPFISVVREKMYYLQVVENVDIPIFLVM